MNKAKEIKETNNESKIAYLRYSNLRTIKKKILMLKMKNQVITKILVNGSTVNSVETNNVLFIKSLYHKLEESLSDKENINFLLNLKDTFINEIILDYEKEKSFLLDQLTKLDIPEKKELLKLYKGEIENFNFYKIVESGDLSELSYNQAMLLFTIIKFSLNEKSKIVNEEYSSYERMEIDKEINDNNPFIESNELNYCNISDQIKNDFLSESESSHILSEEDKLSNSN